MRSERTDIDKVHVTDCVVWFFFFFFSSGPRAYAPDAPQPIDLLCNPSIVQTFPPFSASPPSRPCYSRDPWQWKVELLRGRETWPTILPKCTSSTEHFRDLLHAVNVRHRTDGFTSPPKEGALRFFFALKNPTASAGFEPANLGTKGQHATSRPPKPLCGLVTLSYDGIVHFILIWIDKACKLGARRSSWILVRT